MYDRDLATRREYKKWIKNTKELAEHLRSSEVEGHFSMMHWYSHDNSDHKHNVKDASEVLNHCGTTACAWGHAATLPNFIRQGLEYTNRCKYDKRRRIEWSVNMVPEEHHNYADGKKKYNLCIGDYDYGYHLFGVITECSDPIASENEHLFGDRVDRSPKQEARVLDNYARKLEREVDNRWSN